jgi:hypothetical protein
MNLASSRPCRSLLLTTSIVLGCLLAASKNVHADDDSSGHKFGLLGLLDRRSQYGKGVFPEPFLVDDSDLEVNELRFDWFHQKGKGTSGDEVTAEFEKGFGLLTIEVELHYERSTEKFFDTSIGRTSFDSEEGLGNVDLGARYPIWQHVSRDEVIDNTLGVGFEVGIPTNTRVSKNTELVPKIFDDLRIGNHFTLQAIVGYSFLLGPGPDGGAQTLEYGLDFGWTIHHPDLPLPGIEQIIPVFELAGETALNHGDGGHNSLTGVMAFRFNLHPIGDVQPRLGVGYAFPIDKGARDDFQWGIVTSLVFEY